MIDFFTVLGLGGVVTLAVAAYQMRREYQIDTEYYQAPQKHQEESKNSKNEVF